MLDAEHDHYACVERALARAEALCEVRGERLTPIRRRVLELVWADHAGVKAYDLLEQLRQDGRSAQPPTVYRALDFLMRLGLIHRIESQNAFIGCIEPERPHHAVLLVCQQCGLVEEIPEHPLLSDLKALAEEHGFEPKHPVVEYFGLCPQCRTVKHSLH